MHSAEQGSNCQEIYVGSFQFTRGGSGEYEPMVLLSDEAMNFVQEVWQSLDFIDENPTLIRERSRLPGETGHIRQIRLIWRFIEQIYRMGGREFVSDPCGFARSSGPE